MNKDPLAKYRRSYTPGAPAQPPEGEDEGYYAFGTKDRPMCLRVHCDGLVHAIDYRIYLAAVYDRECTNLIITFTIAAVVVKGRNLRHLIHAIENHKADFIEAFDPERWDKPADASQAIIESIEIDAKKPPGADETVKH